MSAELPLVASPHASAAIFLRATVITPAAGITTAGGKVHTVAAGGITQGEKVVTDAAGVVTETESIFTGSAGVFTQTKKVVIGTGKVVTETEKVTTFLAKNRQKTVRKREIYSVGRLFHPAASHSLLPWAVPRPEPTTKPVKHSRKTLPWPK